MSSSVVQDSDSHSLNPILFANIDNSDSNSNSNGIPSESSTCTNNSTFPPAFLQKLTVSDIPVTSISNASITCSSINSSDNCLNIVPSPFHEPCSTSLTSTSLTSTAVDSSSLSNSNNGSVDFSSLSTQSFSYLSNQLDTPLDSQLAVLEPSLVKEQNPACIDSKYSHINTSKNTKFELVQNNARTNTNDDTDITPTSSVKNILPKTSDLYSLFYDTENSNVNSFNINHVPDSNDLSDSKNLTKLTSQSTLTRFNVLSSANQPSSNSSVSKTATTTASTFVSAPASEIQKKEKLQKQARSQNNTSSQNPKTVENAENLQNPRNFQNVDTTRQVSETSSDFSYSVLSKFSVESSDSSITSFSALKSSSPIQTPGNTASVLLSSSSCYSPSLVSSTSHVSSPSLISPASPLLGTDHGGCPTAIDPKNESQHEKSKNASKSMHLTKKGLPATSKNPNCPNNSRLKLKPSMLDLIDNQKLTTFPQVYNTIAGHAKNRNHLNSKHYNTAHSGLKDDSFHSRYYTFSGSNRHSNRNSSGLSGYSKDVQDFHFDGETIVFSHMGGNSSSGSSSNVSGGDRDGNKSNKIVFVENYFDETEPKTETLHEFRDSSFSSNFGSNSYTDSAYYISNLGSSVGLDSFSDTKDKDVKLTYGLSNKNGYSTNDSNNNGGNTKTNGKGSTALERLRSINEADLVNWQKAKKESTGILGSRKGLKQGFMGFSSLSSKSSNKQDTKKNDNKLDCFNDILSTPQNTTRRNSSLLSTPISASTVVPISTPKQPKPSRNFSNTPSFPTFSFSSQHCQLSPFSAMRRRSSLIKSQCVHCHKQICELADNQYFESVCNDCSGFHQILTSNENNNNTKSKNKHRLQLDENDADIKTGRKTENKGYNTGPPLIVNKVRKNTTLKPSFLATASTPSLPSSPSSSPSSPVWDSTQSAVNSKPHNLNTNYTTVSSHMLGSAIDLTTPSSASSSPSPNYLSANTSRKNGRHTIGPTTNLSALASSSTASLNSFTSFVSNFSTNFPNLSTLSNLSLQQKQHRALFFVPEGNPKMEWYATMKRKLRWRWRFSGLLPQGVAPLGSTTKRR